MITHLPKPVTIEHRSKQKDESQWTSGSEDSGLENISDGGTNRMPSTYKKRAFIKTTKDLKTTKG
jgi:hypothetical protein